MGRIYILLILLSSTLVFAGDFEDGIQAYESGEYELASQHFWSEIEKGNHSEAVYSNLGKAYFELDSIGKAVWGFQMALKVNPSSETAINDLEFLESKIKDDVQLFDPGLMRWLTGLVFSVGQNFWIYTGILISIILSIIIFIYATSKRSLIKTFSFYGAWAFGVILIISVVLGYYHSERLTNYSMGVVINEELSVFTNPTENATSDILLHAGTTFELINSAEGYRQIKTGEVKGWVLESEIWIY